MVIGQEVEGSVIRVSVNKDGNAIGLISILGSWLNDVYALGVRRTLRL